MSNTIEKLLAGKVMINTPIGNAHRYICGNFEYRSMPDGFWKKSLLTANYYASGDFTEYREPLTKEQMAIALVTGESIEDGNGVTARISDSHKNVVLFKGDIAQERSDFKSLLIKPWYAS